MDWAKIDWTRIPDILAITALASAFFSILRRNRTAEHRLWLTGWIMIALHFFGFLIIGLPGVYGVIGSIVGLTSLVAAGIFFMWATVPAQVGISSRRMATVALFSLSLYAALLSLPSAPGWAFDLAATLIAVGPLSVAIYYRSYSQHPLRWITVSMMLVLGAFLLVLQNLPSHDTDTALNAILFTVYFGCCVHFWNTYKRGTTGSIITISGFFAWALVFLISPLQAHYFPNLQIESEVWNLPKYVVAVGMMLLLLEKQIERTQYLALHDDLTKLANRRLFKDRLSGAMERAKRAESTIALLQIDLDGFKYVNDSFGHHVGDLLLQHVARLLEGRVRRSDTVARTGGDEFSLILEEPAGREDAILVAESLSQKLAEPFELAGTSIRIGASIGFAIYPEDASEVESLCIEADLRMYNAKQTHREIAAEFRHNSLGIPEPHTLSQA